MGSKCLFLPLMGATGPQINDLGSLEIGKIEVYKWVDIGMNLGHGYMISTFQNHISKNAAVKGV